MAAKVSLLIVKKGDSFFRVYHKALGFEKGATSPISAQCGSVYWSHPKIMSSHVLNFNGVMMDLNKLLDGHCGKWAEVNSQISHYPHTRLEIMSKSPSYTDPLDPRIPDAEFTKNLVFKYDNPSGFVLAGASLPRGMADDDITARLMADGVLPNQIWALHNTRRIESYAIKDLLEMRAKTWVNPVITADMLPDDLHPQDCYMIKPGEVAKDLKLAYIVDGIKVFVDASFKKLKSTAGVTVGSAARLPSATDEYIGKIQNAYQTGVVAVEAIETKAGVAIYAVDLDSQIPVVYSNLGEGNISIPSAYTRANGTGVDLRRLQRYSKTAASNKIIEVVS